MAKKTGFTLRVTFHGIIMYTERPKNHVTMLLCQLDPKTFTRGTSYVLFKERNYSPEANHRLVLAPKKKDSPYRHIELDGEHLVIAARVAPESSKLHINKRKDRISSTPTAYDEYSVKWLTSLAELAAGHEVNPGYFQTPPTGTPRLVARVEIAQGSVRTNGVERLQVPFRRGKVIVQQRAIARELVVEMTVDDDHFVLQSTPLDPNSATQPNRSIRFDANGDEFVEIHIGNEQFSDIYDDAVRVAPIDVLEKNAAREYEFYYRLCKDLPEQPRVLPHVGSREPGTTFCTVNNGGPPPP